MTRPLKPSRRTRRSNSSTACFGAPVGTAAKPAKRVGEVIVGVARHRNGLRRLHLSHTGRRQRQDLHIDAGRIHFPQPFGAEVTKPVHNLGIAAADLFGAYFDKTCRSIEKFRGRKMLFQSNGAHTRSFDRYWGTCSGAYREIVNYMAASAGPAC